MTEEELYHHYKGVYIPKLKFGDESLQFLEDFTFRPDDILIVTYPKSGTNWMQYIVSLITNEGDSSIDNLSSWQRAPWLELHISLINLEEMSSPRLLTTHFNYNMMPQSFFEAKPRVIYVMRNPKDVFTSNFHFHEIANFLVKPGSPSQFLHKFLNGKVVRGSWFDHIKGWLNAANKEHILYISYEELTADLKASVAKVAEFLEKNLDDEVIEKITEKCRFDNMKENKMLNHSDSQYFDQTKTKFFRKGVVGDWKNLLTAEEADHFDAVYKEKMKDVDFKFPWD